MIDELTLALTRAIEELTRPVDAIKHQAKTVTVGISRSDESLMTEALVRELLATGAPRDAVGYADLRALAALGPLVRAVHGYSRYVIDEERGVQTIRQVASGGSATGLRSRTLQDPELRGTKHLVARERRILVATGRSDGRTVLFVPEVRNGRTTGITLLHVDLVELASGGDARCALEAYRNRYAALRDVVRETEPVFDDSLLATIPVLELLTAPVHELADSWRGLGRPRATELSTAGCTATSGASRRGAAALTSCACNPPPPRSPSPSLFRGPSRKIAWTRSASQCCWSVAPTTTTGAGRRCRCDRSSRRPVAST